MTDATSKQAVENWMQSMLTNLQDNITKLQGKRAIKPGPPPAGQPPGPSLGPPAIASATASTKNSDGVSDNAPDGTIMVAPGDVNPAPVFGLGPTATSGGSSGADADTSSGGNGLPQAGSPSDPWTTISCSFSAADQSSVATTSSWGFSVGGGAGWGLWSVGRAYSHDQSSSDLSSDMASCDVSVTFSALVVNVGRPWLYGELFADTELDAAKGINLSPGPEMLKTWTTAQNGGDNTAMHFDTATISKLSQYSMFPPYPVSLVIAADTTIEFHGDTQHIEKHFSQQSNSGSLSVGWRPFSVSSSFHQASSRQSFQMQSTATRCRLSFGAPQIIGWVNQILPALPRLDGFDPMVQNLGVWKATW